METAPLTPEILVPRLGDYLVEKGMITREDLARALETQHALRKEGRARLIGDLLIDLNIVTLRERDRAITELLRQYQAALQDANQQLELRVHERTAELQKAMEQLATINEIKSNLVANLSHELRTPLTHLSGYLDLLSNGDLGALNAEQQNALNIMQRASERLSQLIEDLILFSISEKDRIYLHTEGVDLSDMMVNVIQRGLSKARERNVQFDVSLPSSPVSVDADRDKISWVLMQLVDNALKFTPRGGYVRLEAELEGPFIQFEVSDTGIGIPEESIPHIFEPFRQLDGSSTRKAGGTGLGLALARRIVEAHGSIIHVYSKVNQGSRFEFRLHVHQNGA